MAIEARTNSLAAAIGTAFIRQLETYRPDVQRSRKRDVEPSNIIGSKSRIKIYLEREHILEATCDGEFEVSSG